MAIIKYQSLLDTVMSRNQWHIKVHRCHLMFKGHWRAPHETIYGHKKKVCLGNDSLDNLCEVKFNPHLVKLNPLKMRHNLHEVKLNQISETCNISKFQFSKFSDVQSHLLWAKSLFSRKLLHHAWEKVRKFSTKIQ